MVLLFESPSLVPFPCKYQPTTLFHPHGIVFTSFVYYQLHLKDFYMKHLISRSGLKGFFSFLVLCFVQMIVIAQDTTSSSTSSTKTTTTTTTTWYTQPWVWVAGGALLLILIIALMRNNSSTSVEKTTVVRDTTRERDN